MTQPLKTSLIGIFQTAVLTRNGGLAATIPFAVLRQTSPLIQVTGLLLNKTPEELAQGKGKGIMDH